MKKRKERENQHLTPLPWSNFIFKFSTRVFIFGKYGRLQPYYVRSSYTTSDLLQLNADYAPFRFLSRASACTACRARYYFTNSVRPSVSPSIQMYNETRICAAEMAVRYAALSACRKVRMPSARAEKYMCVIVIR